MERDHCFPVPHTRCTGVGQVRFPRAGFAWSRSAERGNNREWHGGEKPPVEHSEWVGTAAATRLVRVGLNSTGRTVLPQHTLPGMGTVVFPRPGVTDLRGAGLSVPPCTALAVLCCSGLLPASPTATMGQFCSPKASRGLHSWCQRHRGERGCPTAESRAGHKRGAILGGGRGPWQPFQLCRQGSFGRIKQ